MAFLNRCCASCKVGSVIPRWQNITMVRPAGDTGGAHYTAAPFPRYDESEYDTEHPGSGCNTLPPGTCGGWLAGGDLHGVSAQEIDDMVDDIMACGATAIDHNCYQQNGMVDMTAMKLFGGQWILARKYWHGAFGWKSNDACAKDPNITADQTKYRTFKVKADWSNESVQWNASATVMDSGSYAGTATVDRHSGILTNTLTITEDASFTDNITGTVTPRVQNRNGAGFLTSSAGPIHYLANMPPAGTDVRSVIPPQHNIGDFYCTAQTGFPGRVYENGGYFTDGLDATGARFVITFPVVGTEDNWSVNGSVDCYNNPSNDGVTWVKLGTTLVSISFARSNTAVTYSYALTLCDYIYSSIDTLAGSLTAGLSDPYTSAECYADFLTLLAQWDMSDLSIAKFRTDESLALAPLVIYDEVGPTQPSLTWQITMDDYSGAFINDPNGNAPGSVGSDPGQHDNYGRAPGPGWTGGVDYIPTWPQRAWVDGSNYIWKNADGGLQPISGAGGCHFITPMRTGEIISHTQAGSDRHFWFGYSNLQRLIRDGVADWVGGTNGGFTPDSLPPVAMRWMNNLEALFDPKLASPNQGNFPEAFLSESGGVIRGAKFVQATQQWPSVNFGRPCGADKYAVEQTTVCCITGGAAGSGFMVKPAGNATAPLATPLDLPPGLALNDYVMADAIYKISRIESTDPDGYGNPQWKITVGAKIDDLPTGVMLGDGGKYIGRLRFPTASGICGRAAITTTYASPTVTITSAVNLPYLHIDPTIGTLLVNIYDANMTLLAAAVALTRTSDAHFTCTHAAMPTAAWMTGVGVDWTKYDSSSKRTGVHLAWNFDARKNASGYTGDKPAWYANIPGCTEGTVTQFNYAGGCPAVVGIVPFYSPPADTGGGLPDQDAQTPGNKPVENFSITQILFDFPTSFNFDDVFGAHWQAAVMLTMPDPFWQTPFKPDCDGSVNWIEDNGSGNMDNTDVLPPCLYYAHHPLVEALKDLPPGATLPDGITLFCSHPITPPSYPTPSSNSYGISISTTTDACGDAPDDTGSYPGIETDWGFTGRACATIAANRPFKDDYLKFVSC